MLKGLLAVQYPVSMVSQISNCYWTQPNDASGGGTGSNDDASQKITSPTGLAAKLGNAFKDGADGGYPILTWQTGSAPEPAKPGIRIESSSGSSIWTVAGGKNQTSSTTLSVAYDNMGEAKPNVTWVYPAESDAAVISVSTTDQNKLIVDAAGKKGGVLDITAKVTYNNEKYTQTLKLTVIPNITKVQIKNVDDGAVAVGQTVKAKVNVKGGRAYDETTMPPLTYQWYQRNSLSTSGTGTLITGAKENTYSIPNDFADNQIRVEVYCTGQKVAEGYSPVESADKGKLHPVAYDSAFTLPKDIKKATTLELKKSHSKDGVTANIEWSSNNAARIDAQPGAVTLPPGRERNCRTDCEIYL